MEPYPAATVLAATPRRVPTRFVLAEVLPFRWWYVFALFVVAIPPIIVWILEPALLLPAAVAVLLVIYAIHLRGAMTRLALLKWGRVANVVDVEVISQATYYGGTTYRNVVLPVARGWTVTRPVWSGPKTKTRIRYELDGHRADLVVGGREYVDGIVLADERNPERALCVTSFPYDLDRDETGNWTGRLRTRLQVGMAAWLIVMIGWLAGAACLFTHPTPDPTQPTTQGTRHSPMTPAPGETAVVNGAGETRTIVCNGNDVTVNGAANHVDVTGHCHSLTVSGSENQVSVDVADVITTNGMNNVVTYRAGAPTVNDVGMGNAVRPG